MDKRFLFIPISFFMLASQMTFAGASPQMNFAYGQTKNQWLIGIGGGGAFRNLSSSTSVSNGTPVPVPYNTDIFTISTSDHPASVVSLFGGYQWNRLSTYIPYYNLNLHYEHQYKAKIVGQVQQYASPTFTNYNYSMLLKSDILGVTGKLGLMRYKCWLPFFSAGIGAAFNHVKSYSESPIPPVTPARISPNYGSNNNTNFAYTVGAGLDMSCCRNTWISLAYEYWNLGKVNSGSGAGSWSSTRLNFGTLKSNTILATATYFIE